MKGRGESPERNDAMRKANRKRVNDAIYKRLAEVRMSDRDRERATSAIRHAEAIVDALVWVKERIASLSATVLKPGFKH
jgi:hypothetical protein